MSSKSSPAVVIKAPALNSAWLKVCTISSKSESEIIKAVEAMALAMNSESRLSIADQKKFIISTGKKSAFISTSHICALPTWLAMRSNVKGFKDLALAKQLSTSTGAYDNLGAGKGESLATVEALTKATKAARKAKADKRKAAKSVPATTSAKGKNTLTEILAYLTVLPFDKLTDDEWNTVAEITNLLEIKADAITV